MMILLTRTVASGNLVAASLILTACGGSDSAVTSAASESSVTQTMSYKTVYSFDGNLKGKYDGENPAAGLTVLKGNAFTARLRTVARVQRHGLQRDHDR